MTLADLAAATNLDLTPWGKWLSLAEALAERSLAEDPDAYAAFAAGVLPEKYVDATAEPCATCQVPGAPSHEPSPRCQYRPRIVHHCTCERCF